DPVLHRPVEFTQYRHQAYRGLLDRHGATQSMSRKGACLDNAMIENFFGHVKTEWFYPGSFPSITEVEAGLHEYIRWYNHDRIRNTHDGLPPVVFRARAMAV
ncbi:IS3 family transposase, partial [Gulosibacter macacae]